MEFSAKLCIRGFTNTYMLFVPVVSTTGGDKAAEIVASTSAL